MIAGRLPLLHRDPFDRTLIAQAQCENLTLVTANANCQKYDVSVLPGLGAGRHRSSVAAVWS